MTSLHALRTTVQELSDDQIRGAITALVHGLVTGMIGDISERVDEIVDDVVHSICAQLAAAAEQHQDATTKQRPRERKPAPLKMPGPMDRVKYTCEVCGREGTRRYVQTATGWRCSPSSAERCERRAAAQASPAPRDPKYAHRNGRGLPGAASDIPAKEFPANVTPVVDDSAPISAPSSPVPEPAQVTDRAPAAQTGPAAPTPMPRPRPAPSKPGQPPITARCQHCPRTWNLTGRVLDQAIALHDQEEDASA